jgi:enoyl-CoA hydratase / 3-hydroxyacyl-CoA dehydrogenase
MRDLGEAEVMRIVKSFDQERPGFPLPKASYETYQDFKRFLLVDEIDGVVVITLRRPEALNAISDEINNEILSVLKENADKPEVKGFVITGYGTRAFSAGADIGKFPQTLGNFAGCGSICKGLRRRAAFHGSNGETGGGGHQRHGPGGGFEIALRCHGMVATKNAFFQFPEITLGILPGIGGCIVPYRKWPQGAKLFHEMICVARPINAKEALEIGMVSKVVDTIPDLIAAAVEEVKSLQGKIRKIPDGKVEIPEFTLPDPPVAGKQALSREAVAITMKTIQAGAAATTFAEALEIGYNGSPRSPAPKRPKKASPPFWKSGGRSSKSRRQGCSH